MILKNRLPVKIRFLTGWHRALMAALGLGLALPVCAAAGKEQAFNSPDEAVNALVTAAQNNDTNAIHLIFGPAGHELISPDVVQATDEFKMFKERLMEKTQLIINSDSNATLELGADGWPFPIPLVKQDPQWHFDSAAGQDEIFARRIGSDEMGAIDVCNAYVEAQREYASQDRMGDGVLAYAQFLRSASGTESAIHEYVGIVLSNSVYPDAFPVSHDHEFDLSNRELRLTVTVPPPSDVPAIKEYTYVKAKDEITATLLPLKARKDRYAGAVHQVAVRSLHEIFEADRGGKIHSIALTLGTEAVSPATGLSDAIPLVIVAADRETFSRFDLSNVIPRATLDHLGAAVSRSPFDLTPADPSHGVRARRQ